MRKTYFLFLLILTTQLVGCYEDKGNYDYKDIQEIEIKFKTDEWSLNLIFGDKFTLETILSKDIKANSPDHKFTWFVNGETREGWNGDKFEWVVDQVFKDGNITLEIEDTRNGMKYMQRIDADVVGPYESEYSWMILSDNNGKSQLSFFSCIETDLETLRDHVLFKETKFFEDVYTDANNGAELGSGPMRLQEHFTDDYWTNGNVFVFQESGAVDLSGVTFEKTIDMKDAFDGGVLPNILYPGSPMTYVEIISDIDGRLYKRVKKSAEVFNSEYYLQFPLQHEGEILEKCMVCRGYYESNRNGYAVVYDGKNKRLLYTQNPELEYNWDIYEEEDFVLNAGRMFELPAGHNNADITKFVPLNDFTGYEVLSVEISAGSVPKASDDYGFFMLLRHEATNNLFIQRFELKGANGNPVVTDVKLIPVVGVPSIPTAHAFPVETPIYVFFAVGTELYMMDIENPSKAATVYYDFDANITALNFKSDDNVHLAVGLEDGSFFIMDAVNAKNNKDIEKRVIYKSDKKVGRIVDIHFKNNNSLDL